MGKGRDKARRKEKRRQRAAEARAAAKKQQVLTPDSTRGPVATLPLNHAQG